MKIHSERYQEETLDLVLSHGSPEQGRKLYQALNEYKELIDLENIANDKLTPLEYTIKMYEIDKKVQDLRNGYGFSIH